MNFNLQWNPWSPPPIVAAINGPASIHPAVEETWSVDNVTGSGSISYEWRLDGDLVGTSSTYSTTIADPGSVHSLSVDVYNGTDYWERANMMLSVNSGSCDPEDTECHESLRMWPAVVSAAASDLGNRRP